MTLTEFIDLIVDDEFTDFLDRKCRAKGIAPEDITISDMEWASLRFALNNAKNEGLH